MTLTPSSATYVKPGATIELAAKLESQPPDDNSKITYKWSVSGNASGLLLNPVDGNRSTSFETTSKTVTYVASTNALNSLKDTVSVTAIYTSRIDSSVTRAFSAPTTSTLTVSGGQVVLDGRYEVIGWARTDRFAFAGLYQANVYVVVPFVKDAKSYVVRGFNFNDPSFYGTSLTRSFSGQQVANLPVWDLSFGITPSGSNFTMPDVSRVGNEVYISIAGSGGDSSTEGQYRARFSGMQVEVTVQLP